MYNMLKVSFNYQSLFPALFKKIHGIISILGRHTFLLVLLCIFLNILLGTSVLYIYVVIKINAIISASQTPVKFQESLYMSVMQEWQERRAALENTLNTDYADPFQ